MNSNSDLWAALYEQRSCVINGRHVWLYLIQSAIGNIAVVDYEVAGEMNIKRKLFEEHYDDAEKYFESVSRRMLAGKL